MGKRINFYGSYSYSNRDNGALTYTAQQNFNRDTTFVNNDDNISNTLGQNHRIFLNLEYQIDSFNYVKISPTASFATNNGTSTSLTDVFKSANSTITKTQTGNINTNNTSNTPNVSGSILFNHKFRKKEETFRQILI